MLKEESNGGSTTTNSWARICDTCRSAPCTVYCRADRAFLCRGCDARIHAANLVASRHERVWVCEACERAPAAFLCKADAASLCATCDSDIHSANPLARRHHRVPILPIPGTLYGPQAMGGHVKEAEDDFLTVEANETTLDEDVEDEAASWLLLNPVKNNNQSRNNGVLFGGGESVDDYLDLDEYNSDQQIQFGDHHHHQQQQFYSIPDRKSSNGNDSVVTTDQSGEVKKQVQQPQQQQYYHNFQLGLDYDASNPEYGYPASFGHSVSVSSLDVGVVPESTISDVSISHPRPPKGTIDLFSSPPIQMPSQLTPSDREARVLRYREKKKARKFEKKIRYASRKAYAETRPRIKGRFAKRSDVEVEVDRMFSTTLVAESGYGVVPSF